jgi:hypothetical protein
MADKLAFFLAKAKGRLADAPEAEPDGDEEYCCPEDLQAAAEDILVALGQDYGSSANAQESQRQEFADKAKRLAKSLHAFFTICDGMPHSEGGE